MRSHQAGELLLAATAASDGTTAERAHALLGVLRPLVPFDGAWLALTDPIADSYQSLASMDLDDPTVEFLSGPSLLRNVEATGTDPAFPPFYPSTVGSSRTGRRLDMPGAVGALPTWAECTTPTGIREALAVALFAPRGRHVGLLALLSKSQQPPSPAARRRLGRLAPVLAHGIDPMRSLVTAARLVPDATAGVVLHADDGCESLPGLTGDVLLLPGPLLVAARDRIDEGQIFSSVLWPRGGRHAPGGHVRVTVLRAPEDVPPGMQAVVLLSPATDRHGLTPRELDVLGLLVEGCSNQEIARALVVAQRTVATHLEHVLAKLEAPTRTLAAVHAQRDGLYVPPVTGQRSAVTHRECPGPT